MLREQMEEYVEVSREIVKVMISDNAAAPLKKSLDRQEAIITSLIDTELQASDLIRGARPLIVSPRGLLSITSVKQSATSKLHHMERELQDVSESNAAKETNIKFLQREVEDLKVLENEVMEVEREAQEDTTVVIPSAFADFVVGVLFGVGDPTWFCRESGLLFEVVGAAVSGSV
ncbi:PREDICTED: kinetochore protein Spc24-like [Nanorana parkeri]|uniref:kinetochore protein Spc24-like n=1 Tax=Nanorana parkeri TaxID=125878 RepID=UPI000854751D|nr:PREDICTED: kinetochore protein Spc24-like [Nanorana parkeri]